MASMFLGWAKVIRLGLRILELAAKVESPRVEPGLIVDGIEAVAGDATIVVANGQRLGYLRAVRRGWSAVFSGSRPTSSKMSLFHQMPRVSVSNESA